MLGQEQEPSAPGLVGASSHQGADPHQVELTASDLESTSSPQEVEPLQAESIPSVLSWEANPTYGKCSSSQVNNASTQSVGRRSRSYGSIMERQPPADEASTLAALEPLPTQPCKRQPSHSQGGAEKISSSTSAFYQQESSRLDPRGWQAEPVSSSSSAPAILSSSPGGFTRTVSFDYDLNATTNSLSRRQHKLEANGGKLPLPMDSATHERKKAIEARFIKMIRSCRIARQKNEDDKLIVSRGFGLVRDVSKFLLDENHKKNIKLEEELIEILSLLRLPMEYKDEFIFIYSYLLILTMYSFIEECIDNKKNSNKDSKTYIWYFNQLVANTAMVDEDIDDLYENHLNEINKQNKLIRPNKKGEYKIYYCRLKKAGVKLMEDFCVFEANKLREKMEQAPEGTPREASGVDMYQTMSSANVSESQQNEAKFTLLNPSEGSIDVHTGSDVSVVSTCMSSLPSQSSDESNVFSRYMNQAISSVRASTTACLLMEKDSTFLDGPLPSSFVALDPPESQLSPRSAELASKLLAFALTMPRLYDNPALFSMPVSSPRTDSLVSSSSLPSMTFFLPVVGSDAEEGKIRMQDLNDALKKHHRRSLSV